MQTLIAVNDPADWGLSIPGVELVSARRYLADPTFTALRGARVFNLCRSYRYQSAGYYVSLLAEARGHRPQPNVATIQDMKMQTLARWVSAELDELIQSTLRPIRSETFPLSIYFGANLASRYAPLSRQLFDLFPAPLLRAHLVREAGGWRLARIAPIPASAIPLSHRSFVAAAATRYFQRPRRRRKRRGAHYDMAILVGDDGAVGPSDPRAIGKFVRAAGKVGIEATVMHRGDEGHIAEYDALFIRETTQVNHHTYRFCRRAAAEGLVVIDDPDSILRCTNKVYLAQLLGRHRLPTPATLIVHAGNVAEIVPTLGLPCILKQPDSAFSQGVVKAETCADLAVHLERMLERSELVIAQGFVPTSFDWRIGTIDGEALWACRYHMARNHWQIIKRDAKGRPAYGRVESMPVAKVPQVVLDAAVRASRLIGDGLYGVDVKEVEGRAVVIEVNDNPSIDAGCEDTVLKEELYLRIMTSFWRRLESRRRRAEA